MLRLVAIIAALLVWVYSVVDVAQSDAGRVKRLPKGVWLLVTVVLPVLGAIIWFAVGRPGGVAPGKQPPRRPRGPLGPDDDPDFLRGL